jgi:ABC-type bacteriocin/lantibiotic exporter with double-glycine peptidase domain
MGPVCYGGIPGVLLIGLFSYFRTKVLCNYEKRQKELKDERIKISEEVFGAIKYTKLYLLEKKMKEKICQIQEEETKGRRRIMYLEWAQEILTRLVQPVNAMLVLMLYGWAKGDSLDVSVMFTFFSCSNKFPFQCSILIQKPNQCFNEGDWI